METTTEPLMTVFSSDFELLFKINCALREMAEFGTTKAGLDEWRFERSTRREARNLLKRLFASRFARNLGVYMLGCAIWQKIEKPTSDDE